MGTDEQVARQRQRVYGDWRVNMAATSRQLEGLAMQWRANQGDDAPLPEWWAPLTQVAVKLNRIASGNWHPDNFVDLRNYLGFVEAMQRDEHEQLAALGLELAAELEGLAELADGREWAATLGLEPAPEELADEARLLVDAARAAERSPDPSTRNGAALLVAGALAPFTGCNRPAVACDPERLADREWKLAITRHAEADAIEQARASGLPTRGSTMAALWAACPGCARAIVDAGVETLIVSRAALEATPPRWRREVGLGLAVLEVAGVRVYTAEAVGLEMLLDGQRVGV